MNLLSDLVNALAAVIFSALSSMGVGGGSLLLMYLTELRGVEQTTAQGINLICFLAAGAGALPFYFRAGLIYERKRLLFLLIPGVIAALLGAQIAAWLPKPLIRKCFGAFLVIAGTLSLFSKRKLRPPQSETKAP